MKRRASNTIDKATEKIRAAGQRATPARVRVLALLGGAPRGLTHQDIETALARSGEGPMDRVTLYRVLDSLVSGGLALRQADESRVFRFSAAEQAEAHAAHAHFRCDGCGRVFCLNAPPPAAPALPAGFRLSRMSLDLRGECSDCSSGRRPG
ncbi:MAG: hypothetical protein FJX48_13210 [Alphaproteobacteria bacterium]|nr:hypothetical protein [Betaproteobacteria bacterium]MBM3564065.1 hypothetical protein [Alphaproteobacteria bacterium]